MVASGGQEPPGVRIKIECKPNPSLSGVWFIIPAAGAAGGCNHVPNVNQILLSTGFGL